MAINLETYFEYDPTRTLDSFQERGWKAELVKASNVDLVETDKGAALHCIDGRFGNLSILKKYGPAIPGGIDSVAALATGGDLIGFNYAVQKVKGLGYNLGTHGAEHEGEGCGYFGLWKAGRLESAIDTVRLPFNYIQNYGLEVSDWVKKWAKLKGGKHFTLPGVHEEQALTLNPFRDTTVRPRADRFIGDKWFLRTMGISEQRSLLVFAETVEMLAPHAKKVEILIR